MSKYLTAGIVGVAVGVIAVVAVGVLMVSNQQGRQGSTVDQTVVGSTQYTVTSVSSTRQKVCSANAARKELAFSDLATSNTSTLSLFFTSASTTVAATSGYAIAPIIVAGEPWVVPFTWYGEVWAVRNQGTAANVVCDEGQ